MEEVKVQKLKENARLPLYATACSAGADLCACLDAPVTIEPNRTVMIPLGFCAQLPAGCAGLVFARSGLATKRGLAPANKVGVIDPDYRGQWFVPLHNHGTSPQTVEDGERIAQLILTPYVTGKFVEAQTLSETERGDGGFGSTGTR